MKYKQSLYTEYKKYKDAASVLEEQSQASRVQGQV